MFLRINLKLLTLECNWKLKIFMKISNLGGCCYTVDSRSLLFSYCYLSAPVLLVHSFSCFVGIMVLSACHSSVLSNFFHTARNSCHDHSSFIVSFEWTRHWTRAYNYSPKLNVLRQQYELQFNVCQQTDWRLWSCCRLTEKLSLPSTDSVIDKFAFSSARRWKLEI